MGRAPARARRPPAALAISRALTPGPSLDRGGDRRAHALGPTGRALRAPRRRVRAVASAARRGAVARVRGACDSCSDDRGLLLVDEHALRRAAGNPDGTEPIEMPPLRALEGLSDPKAALRVCLERASGLKGRRLTQFDRVAARRRVAEEIEDYSALRALPAYRELERALDQVWAALLQSLSLDRGLGSRVSAADVASGRHLSVLCRRVPSPKICPADRQASVRPFGTLEKTVRALAGIRPRPSPRPAPRKPASRPTCSGPPTRRPSSTRSTRTSPRTSWVMAPPTRAGSATWMRSRRASARRSWSSRSSTSTTAPRAPSHRGRPPPSVSRTRSPPCGACPAGSSSRPRRRATGGRMQPTRRTATRSSRGRWAARPSRTRPPPSPTPGRRIKPTDRAIPNSPHPTHGRTNLPSASRTRSTVRSSARIVTGTVRDSAASGFSSSSRCCPAASRTCASGVGPSAFPPTLT